MKIGDMKYVVWHEEKGEKKGVWYNMNANGKDTTNDLKLAHRYTYEEALKFIQENKNYIMSNVDK